MAAWRILALRPGAARHVQVAVVRHRSQKRPARLRDGLLTPGSAPYVAPYRQTMCVLATGRDYGRYKGRNIMYHAALSTAAAESAADGYEWEFEIGKCVTHKSQPLPSLVMWRTRAGGAGREIYGLRSFLRGDKHRDRLILADSLRAAVPHSADCDSCQLYDTGLCPGLLGND